MYHKILVAYDGTHPGDTALDQGADLARVCTAELHVLAIVVTAGGMVLDPAILSGELLDAERACLARALDTATSDLAKRGITATTCIRDGDAALEILAYAHTIKADLVVIGHGHKGLLARWFEGSVGTRLTEAMPCSVLIAAQPKGSHPCQS